jgi:tRNA(Ile)-lysidine synthase
MSKAVGASRKRLKRGPVKATNLRRRPTRKGELPIEARRHPLVAEIERQLVQCGVLGHEKQGRSRLVLGVSGGADSVALLLACVALRDRKTRPSLEPIVGHVHHHLRATADEDAMFVCELCKRFSVDCHIADVHPGDMRGNVSANARVMRYEALAQLARQVGAFNVAVAHHGDDQLETMLIALCRGAGIDGLTGMALVRPLWCEVSLVRPLLTASKADCESLCAAAGIRWRNDPTNTDPQRARARLRRDVLPHLHELWPDAARRIHGTADAMRAAKTALETQLEDVFGPAEQRTWPRAKLKDQHAPVLAAGLRRAALDAAPLAADELNQRHLLLAAECIRSSERKPRRFDWPRRLRLSISSKQITLEGR